jgi:hypothetical protein
MRSVTSLVHSHPVAQAITCRQLRFSSCKCRLLRFRKRRPVLTITANTVFPVEKISFLALPTDAITGCTHQTDQDIALESNRTKLLVGTSSLRLTPFLRG